METRNRGIQLNWLKNFFKQWRERIEKNREEAIRRRTAVHVNEDKEDEQEMFCAECEERQMFRKVKGGGWQCAICGHWIADEYESESDEDTQIEELDWF